MRDKVKIAMTNGHNHDYFDDKYINDKNTNSILRRREDEFTVMLIS